MRNRKVKLLAPLALLSAAVLAVSGGLATAAGSSTGGEVHWYEADTALAGSLGTVVLTGAITDHGTDHQGVADGGNYNRFVLSKGSFEINIAKFGNQLEFPGEPRRPAPPTARQPRRYRSSRHRDRRLQGHHRRHPDHGHLRMDPATTA